MTVDAGAVVDARAESTMEKAGSRCRIGHASTNTAAEAVHASRTVMTSTRIPFLRSAENLKNSPVLKAMKASAISGRNCVPSMKDSGIRLKKNGPMRIPATM